jgi:2-polyprenyl-3-methyl-5-hydroxy-6-metoxy-1,4-benzoquinol methylase
MRKLLRRIPGARRAYRQSLYLYWALRLKWFVDKKRLNDGFHLNREWNFESSAEQQRHGLVLAAASSLCPALSDANVLELGCSDGVFTPRLAKVCASVTACDISPVAREMAARRCQGLANVAIRELDLVHDAIPGRYDIIFAMDVLEFIHGGKELRAAVKKMEDALHPRGLLVVSACRLVPVLRSAWWQRWLPQGGDAIVKQIASAQSFSMEHLEYHPGDGDGGLSMPVGYTDRTEQPGKAPAGALTTDDYYADHVIAVFSKKG